MGIVTFFLSHRAHNSRDARTLGASCARSGTTVYDVKYGEEISFIRELVRFVVFLCSQKLHNLVVQSALESSDLCTSNGGSNDRI